MKEGCCVSCGRSVLDCVIVCAECAKTLGEPKRARSEDAIMTFKIDRRKPQTQR